jgi:methionyl-tRNA formyltransferase
MGSDAIALPALNWIASGALESAEIVAVFTQPDRAVGRGQKIQSNEIKQWAEARGIPVVQPVKFADADRALLAGFKPDLTLVMAYGHILKQDVIDTPRLGTLNLHTSVLPKYRGASPIQTAITCGETETGVTLMRMVLKLDAGPVADVERVAIERLDTSSTVEAKLAQACVPLLARCLLAIVAGTQKFAAQDEAAATFCRRLEKSDGVLDFQLPASLLASRINGLMPWPACTVTINGQVVKLGLADSLSENSGGVGEVIGSDTDGLLIGTGTGILRLRLLQRPGGRLLPAAEFLRGFPVEPGTQLSCQSMPPLVAREPFPRMKSNRPPATSES